MTRYWEVLLSGRMNGKTAYMKSISAGHKYNGGKVLDLSHKDQNSNSSENLPRLRDPRLDSSTKAGFGRHGIHVVEIDRFPKMVPDERYDSGESSVSHLVPWIESPIEIETEVSVVQHSPECDELLYGQACSLEDHTNMVGWEEFLDSDTSSGKYWMWLNWENGYVRNWSHEGWEWNQWLEWETYDPENRPFSNELK